MSDDQELPRSLTLMDTTAVVIGSMIGSGIFLKASGMAQLLPDPRLLLLAWLVSGVLTLFGALSMAELGAMYPRSGGLYVYLKEAYGPFVAFLFGWSLLAILQTGSIAGLAAGISQIVAHLTGVSATFQTVLSVVLILGLSAVNAVSVKLGAGALGNLFTFTKCGGILLLILAAARAEGGLANFQAAAGTPTGLALVSAFGLVMVKSLWAYDGWINATFVAGEVRSAQRNLPLALVLGTLVVLAFYLSTNAAYHYSLTLIQVQQARSTAVELALIVGGASAAVAMTALAAISMLGTLNSSILSAPRVYYAMARDGLFFRQLAEVHPRWLTPHRAIAVQALWSLGLLALWGSFERITDNVIFVFWIFYALGAAAVPILRRRDPQRERTYKVPGYPITVGIFLLLAAALTANTIISDPVNSCQALGLLGPGAVFYVLWRRLKRTAPDSLGPVGRGG